MEDKRKVIDSSLDKLYKGFELLFQQQLTEVYDKAQNKSCTKIEQLEEVIAKLRAQLEETRRENESLRSSQQSYINEINELKNAGDLFSFISKGLYPKINALQTKIQNFSENNQIAEELEVVYMSLIQTMERFDMELFSSNQGEKVDYFKHQVEEAVSTNNRNEHETILQSLAPGVKFPTGECIKEKVKITVYESNGTSFENLEEESKNKEMIVYSLNDNGQYYPVVFEQNNEVVYKLPYIQRLSIFLRNLDDDKFHLYNKINIDEILKRNGYCRCVDKITLAFSKNGNIIKYFIVVDNAIYLEEEIKF